MSQIRIFKSFSKHEFADPIRGIKLAAKAGYDGAEFYHDLHLLSKKQLLKIKAAAQKSKLQLSVHLPTHWVTKIGDMITFNLGDKARAKVSEAFLRKYFVISEILGATHLNVHVLEPMPTDGEYWQRLLTPKNGRFPGEEKMRAAAFKRASAIARKFKVPLTIENHLITSHNSLPSDFAKLPKNCSFLIDTGHPFALLQEALEREFWEQRSWYPKIKQIKMELGVDVYGQLMDRFLEKKAIAKKIVATHLHQAIPELAALGTHIDHQPIFRKGANNMPRLIKKLAALPNLRTIICESFNPGLTDRQMLAVIKKERALVLKNIGRRK